MEPVRTFVRRHCLLIFFVLAFAGFWICLALNSVPRFHFWAPLLGTFSPGVSALIVTGMSGGEGALRELVHRLGRWRVGVRWYLVAVCLPLAQAGVAIALAIPFGRFKGVNMEMLRPALPSMWLVFLFATGEELGWRGYALPRLLARRKAIHASLIVGALHALWHWPLILAPHGFMRDIPLLPWTAAVIVEAIVFTWIFQNTAGSVLLVVLFHGMVNASMLLFNGIDAAWMPWLKASLSIITGGVVALLTGPELLWRRRQI